MNLETTETPIAFFEDDPTIRKTIKNYLELDGYNIVIAEGHFQKAIELINELKEPKELMIFIVDGNLIGEKDKTKNTHGERLIEAICEKIPENKRIIIAFSAKDNEQLLEAGADACVTKGDSNYIQKLLEVIANTTSNI